MRKFMAIILTGVLLLSLFSCQSKSNVELEDNDHQTAKGTIETVLDSIQSKDKNKLKTLFSDSVLIEQENFEDSIEALLNYVIGSVKSFDDGAGPYVDTVKENDLIIQIMESSFEVKTTECDYRFAMQYVVCGNADDIGIISLYVIKTSKDQNLDYTYWGDGKFLPGIHLDIPNAV